MLRLARGEHKLAGDFEAGELGQDVRGGNIYLCVAMSAPPFKAFRCLFRRCSPGWETADNGLECLDDTRVLLTVTIHDSY